MKDFKVIIVLLVLLANYSMYSQQDSQFTQYMYNTISINPAYAGTRNVLSINALHRSQWQGIPGAPITQTLSINTPMGERTGLGLSVYREEIGPSIETSFAADLSYILPLNDYDLNFAFGLKGGLHIIDIDYARINIKDPLDPAFQNNLRETSPIVGVGGYLYTEKWYVGLSVPNLLYTKHYKNSSTSNVAKTQHFYLTGGYVFELTDNLKFKPATLFKVTNGAPLVMDLSTNFLINEKVTLGASYRLSAAISALVGVQISDSLFMGYAYDYDTTDIGNYNSGSHEVFLRFEFFRKVQGKVSPRFF